MLTRVFLGLTTALALLIAAPVPPSAFAEADGQCHEEIDPETGQVKWVCEKGGGGGDSGGSTSTSSVCKYEGKVIPCKGPEGSVWNGAGCYVAAPLPDQPEAGPNGEKIPAEGQWHTCFRPSGIEGPGRIWVAVGTQFIDPVTLAERAIATMDLDPIAIGIVPESGPDRVGLVGLPVWMWVDTPTENTFGPITRSSSEGTVSVNATASVSSVAWSMGDGTEAVICTGSGTPYADAYGKQPSPTCGHRYAKTSTDQPDGEYQVTATSRWVVEWTGGGQSGTIEFDLTTEPLPLRIGEAQVLTQ